MYDTENPVPRNGEGRRRRPTAAFRNISVGAGALTAGAGVGYAGLKAGKAAEEWGRSSPVAIGRAAKVKTVGAWKKLRTILKLKSQLREIQLAAGDYARKYLIDDPLLAKPGDPGFDPELDREVKAALLHRHPPELSERAKGRVARQLKREGAYLKSGFAKTETPLSGKRFMPMVKIVRPYHDIRSGISRQKAETTKPPKPGEAPPPDFLPPQKGKVGVRSSSTEVGAPRGDLWDYREASKPTNVKYIYPERVHPHDRPKLSREEVSVRGRQYRDPLASHQARVQAGMTPDLTQTRENPIKGLPEKYLPKAVDIEERRKAQVIRDTLAHRLRALRTETITPMRDIRRKYLGLRKGTMSESSKQKLWAKSESMGDFPIAPQALYKKHQKPRINPMVPILPSHGLMTPFKPVAEHEVDPRVIHSANQKLRARISEVTKGHEQAAESIRQNIHDRLHERYAKVQSSKLLRETSKRLTNETFHPNRVGLGLEGWEAKNLAEDTGTSPEWIHAQHKEYSRRIKLTTGGGEEKIRRAMNLSLFKGIAGAPEPPVKHTYPILKSLGKKAGVGAGIAGALGLGAYAAHKLWKRKETRFAVPGGALKALREKLKGKLGHELAIGTALTGGITAADVATSAIFPGHGQTRKQAAWEGAKRGAIYGSVLSGVEPLIRIPLSRKLAMASKAKEIQFQKWATLHFEDPDIPSPWNKRKRLSVAQDRYRKVIREREIQRKEANLAKSAVAGAAVGGLLHHKVGLRLNPALAVGAATGLGLQTAALLHGRRTKDPYGEESIASKRIERVPYQAGSVAAAGLAAHHLYKSAKKAKLFSVKSGRVIRFQQFIPSDDPTPWHQKVITGWIRHPKSRVQTASKWIGRGIRAHEDIKLPKTASGEVITERGRVRQPEWQKPYVKRALYTGAAVGGLGGLALLGRHYKQSAEVAGKVLAGGARMSDLSQGERFALNVTSGNWLRAIKAGAKSKFPKVSAGVKRLGGIRGELHNIKEDLYRRGNTAIEERVGAITGATTKTDPHTGEIAGVSIINPAKAKEDAARLQAHADQVKQYEDKVRKKLEKVKASQKSRAALEKILKPPEEKFSSRVKEIRFQGDEPGYVKVKPHYRKPRSPQPRTKRQRFREGALIGTAIAGTGIGAGAGIAWDASRRSAAEKIEKKVAQRLAEIAIKQSSHLHVASALLDDLISFQTPSKAEMKRRSGEKGTKRSRTLDVITGGSIGAGLGGGVGALSGIKDIKKKPPGSPKWFDPFKRFRPGSGEEDLTHADYGSTLGIAHQGDLAQDIGGEEWKRLGEHESPAGAFQKGALTEGEKAARRGLTKEFKRSKRIFKRGVIGAGIGAAALGAPFLKKPYASGQGREAAGKQAGAKIGRQIGGFAGLGTGAYLARHAPNPLAVFGGLGAGAIVGNLAGARFGGAIGARTKRRESRSIKSLSAILDEIISLD